MSKARPSVPALERPEPAPLLPAGAAFEGLVTFRGAARVEGELTGRVMARGRLEIGPGARVRARVDVDELVVEGELEGELRVRVRAELRASARVRGRLDAPRVAIAEGAFLEGRCRTGAACPTASDDPSGDSRSTSPPSEPPRAVALAPDSP